jgi:nitroreductase
MNIIEVIKNHQSVNNFSDRLVAAKKIDRIVRAVQFTPLGANQTPLKTLIVTKTSLKQKIRQAAEKVEKAYQHGAGNGNKDGGSGWQKPFLEEAPCLIVVCSLSGQPYQAASTWLAVGNLLRTAKVEGVGANCYAPTMPTFLSKVLNIPARYIPIAIVPVGYPADELFPKYDPAEERLFKNLFSGRFNWQES